MMFREEDWWLIGTEKEKRMADENDGFIEGEGYRDDKSKGV